MRCSLHAPAVIVLALSLFAQQTTQSPDKTEEHSSASCIVGGRVVTADEGSPLKSARILLVPNHSGSKRQIYSASSDSDGRFLIKDVSPGGYTFLATRAGFVDQEYQERGDDGGAVLSLKPGDRISDVLFRLTRTAVVSGRVTNEDGEAMGRIQVAALRLPSEEETEDEGGSTSRKLRTASSAVTDDRGQYRIFDLRPGEYYIKATDSFEPVGNWQIAPRSFWLLRDLGSEYAPVYYPGVSQASQAQTVSVRAGEEGQADIPMQRVKTVEIAGHVIGPDGPAKNAWVQLSQSGEDEYGINRQASTDENGNFKLKSVPQGSYVITAYQPSKEEGSYALQSRQKIEVGGENIDSLIISVGGGINFQGRVTVAGLGSLTLDQLRVYLLGIDENGQFGGSAYMKKDGTFEINSVSDGDYALHVQGLDEGWYVKSARLGSDDILEKGLHVEKGSSAGRLDVVVGSGTAQLEGSVTGGDGAMIGASVRASPEPETSYNRFRSHGVKTDQTGHFSLTGLAPGTYRVLAKYPSSSASGILRSDPQIVTLSDHEQKTVQLTIMQGQVDSR